jgi:4-aminobutyrate aminotransferase
MSKKNLFRGIKRLSDIVVDYGKGSRIYSTEGKSFLDFTAGIGVVSTGHCHPTVVEAVQKQASIGVHMQQSCYMNKGTLELIEKLSGGVVPAGLDSYFFANSGAEAVEGAVRLARQATGKDNIIVFSGGYHGRTLLTLALTSSGAGYRGGRLGPAPGGHFFVPYPYEHIGPHRSADVVLSELEALLKTHTSPTETAAVLIEPVLGEGGYCPPPPGFMSRLAALCKRHNILLIADEVQSGFGRTGTMFAVEHDQVGDLIQT